jgi:hypothetical protein
MARSEITSTIARSDTGKPLSGVSVEVKNRNGTAASVYASESAEAALPSNILTSVNGEISGWLEDGSYTLVMTAPDMATKTEYFEAVSGAAVNAKVPYTGATSDISIGAHSVYASAGVNGEVIVGANITQGGFIGIYPKIVTDVGFSTSVFGDAWDAFAIEARGKLKWGDGTNTWDVTLYRQAADVLKTDDHFAISQPSAGGSAALGVTIRGTTHGAIFNRTEGNPSNGNVLLVTAQDTGTDANPQDTTVGISGYETGKGTVKVSHNKPVAAVTGSDANASVLSLRANGAGTAAQGIFFDAEQPGGTTGRLMNFRQNGVDTFAVDADGDIGVGGFNKNDWETAMQASWVATMPDYLAQSTLSLATATKYGAVAFVRKPGTFSKVAICTSSAPASITDLKVAVWDSNGNLLRASNSAHATVTTANTIYEIALTSSLTLSTVGQRIYIGICVIHTGTASFRGASQVSGMVGTRTGRSFATARANGGYAGTVDTLTTGGTGIVPFAELVV